MVIQFIIAALALMLIGFGMGREWQRLFGDKDDCPFGDECQTCNPRGNSLASVCHVRLTSNATWMIAKG